MNANLPKRYNYQENFTLQICDLGASPTLNIVA
jgi:hypothetical protein